MLAAMQSPNGRTVTPPSAAPIDRRGTGKWRWVAFDPPLRDPRAMSATRFELSCKLCGAVLGTAGDPVDALHLAWRYRRHPKEHVGLTIQPS